jgi:hypothetical protein
MFGIEWRRPRAFFVVARTAAADAAMGSEGEAMEETFEDTSAPVLAGEVDWFISWRS